jgi:hypothetical protein
MWTLIKSELKYYKIHFLFWFNLLLLLVFIQAWLPLLPTFMQEGMNPVTFSFVLFWIIFLMFQMWVTLRNKENRTFQLISLPISYFSIAVARILMILFPCVLLLLISTILIFVGDFPTSNVLRRLIIINGIIISVFSLYFIIRDLFLPFFRRIGLSKERIIAGALLLGVALNLLGLLVFIKTKSGNANFNFFNKIHNILVTYNPFSGDYGLIKFVLFFMSLAFLSVITFSRSKSYLE